MITYEYGNPEADTVLIQPTGEHEMASLENEVREIEKRTSKEFRFIATKVENWNDDLSPWKAPAVFKTEDFCGGASKTLENIIALCADKNRKYYIGGYSLAGLFALWAACQTDIFSGVAAASPSVWFPGFIDYMKTYKMKSQNVYLSLGDREEKTRNPVMAQIGNCIKEEYRCLLENGINCILEWNKGNHFKEADIRTAKAFAWILNNDSSGERTTRLSNL
ncbi:esterase [Blautia sp. HCN-1074]|uniref:esterase n=1 Tax=Blautia sp. HCN-1074 TaxID=3134667 RepID=UPI0030C39972